MVRSSTRIPSSACMFASPCLFGVGDAIPNDRCRGDLQVARQDSPGERIPIRRINQTCSHRIVDNVLGYPIDVFLPPQRVVVVSLLPEWLHSAPTVAVAGNLLE